MSYNSALHIQNLGKCYHVYDKPHERLLQMLFRGRKRYYRESWVLKDVNLEIAKGESLGIIGRNGAGKSTLLQLVCGTLNPTTGTVLVRGRIAALLELGSGFNPEFSGRENVFINAQILGLSYEETVARYEEIVDFSGIRESIDQPVKTYSSGMFVRLAFSVATCVEPDVLIIDEALSVGDGDFAHKSFERIMQLKQGGTTILFCSHSMYQIEKLCSRALWLDDGNVKMFGAAAKVTTAYQSALDKNVIGKIATEKVERKRGGTIKKVTATVGSFSGTCLQLASCVDTLAINIDFQIDTTLTRPSIALGVANASGLTVTSVTSVADDVSIVVNSKGEGTATVIFPQIKLLKGTYYVTVILACDKALHPYDVFDHCLTLQVEQQNSLQGVVALPHQWQI
ncbi:MAG: ABC transporter ATP-binding protein [Desulfuromonas sp.]|nr:ABC transporter ATP-binding protein [Desulfuromonas sp.]